MTRDGEPHDSFDELLEELSDLFSKYNMSSKQPQQHTPSVTVDTRVSDDEYVVIVDAPLFDKEDLGVNWYGKTLHIKGEHRIKTDSRHVRAKVLNESIDLPSDANVGEGEAAFKNGVLKVRFPRGEIEEGKIPIQS